MSDVWMFKLNELYLFKIVIMRDEELFVNMLMDYETKCWAAYSGYDLRDYYKILEELNQS